MKILKGSTRIVLIFDNFVIKIINISYSLKVCRRLFSDFFTILRVGMSIEDFIKKYFLSYLKSIIEPVLENWSEFIFYQRTYHSFCAKTLFSFLGFLNIQERCVILTCKSNEIDKYEKLIVSTINGFSFDEGYLVHAHVFRNLFNFGYSKNGNFVCVDYGNKIVQKNILDFGNEIQKAFENFKK